MLINLLLLEIDIGPRTTLYRAMSCIGCKQVKSKATEELQKNSKSESRGLNADKIRVFDSELVADHDF